MPCSTVEHGLGLPDDLVGRLVFGITVVVLGDVARADALLGGLRRKLPLIADDVRPPRYLELDVRRDEPSGRPGYRKGEHVTELSDDVIDQLVGETRQLPPEGQFFFLPVGGAVASRSLDHAAYGGRTPGWIAQTEVAWDDANSQDPRAGPATCTRGFLRRWASGTPTRTRASTRQSRGCAPSTERSGSAPATSKRASTRTTCCAPTRTSLPPTDAAGVSPAGPRKPC